MNENKKAFLGFISLVIIGLLLITYIPAKKSGNYRKTKLLLDTYVTITVDSQEKNAKEGVEKAFKRMSQIEKKLNRYSSKSEVAKINQNAPKPVAVSKDTLKAVETGLKYSKLSDGKFDITIGALVDLFDFNKKIVPSKARIKKAKPFVNWRYVAVDRKNSTVSLKKSGVILDLGAITKGYAADEARKVLKRNGIEGGLIDTGSSALAFASSNNNRFWRVGLKHPRKDEIISVLKVNNRSLSTSGDYQQYFIKNGKRFHHIINPQTGYPATGVVSVTVMSKKSALDSDILSTAIFVMGADKGINLINSLKDVEAVLILSNGDVKKTGKSFDFPDHINLGRQ